MPDKDQLRMLASILVTQIIAWGGQGKDVAAFLGVSTTTISHWRNLDQLEGRKPTIPSEEHILKLIAILRFRVRQNLGRLNVLLQIGEMDGISPRYSAIIAGEMSKEFLEYGESFAETAKGYQDSVEETIAGLRNIQAKGGDAVLRSLLNPVTAEWGELAPDATPPRPNQPIDLDKVNEELAIDATVGQRIAGYETEFRDKIIAEAREALLKPNLAKPEGTQS